MKFACLMIVTLFTMLSNGFAGEHHRRECRLDFVNFDIERFSVTAEGIFFKTEKFGEISLGNLHFDEKGHFVSWQGTIICTNCKEEYAPGTYVCEHCGSEEKAMIRLDNPDGNEYPITNVTWVLETAQKFERKQYDFQDVAQNHFMTKQDELLAEAYKDSQLGTDILGATGNWGIRYNNDEGISAGVKLVEPIKDKDGNDRGYVEADAGVKLDKNGKVTVELEVGGDFTF